MSPDSKRDFANQITSEYFQVLQDQGSKKSSAEKATALAQAQRLGRIAAAIRSYITSDNSGLADRIAKAGENFAQDPKPKRGLLRFFRW